MYGTIIVPLDGSELAERALPYAVALARPGRGHLILLRATMPTALVSTARGEIKEMREAEQYLRTVSRRISKDVVVETAVFYSPPVEAILEEARLRGAHLIVMSTHGRGGLGRFLHGSVAQEVLAQSPVPVLLVRGKQGAADAPVPAEHPRLLVPLDGSTFARQALELAARLADQSDGDLVLLSAVTLPDRARVDETGRIVATVDQEAAAHEYQALDYLRRVRLEMAPQQRVRTHLDVRTGPPAECIVAAAREHQASLLVMSTHGRTGLSRLLLGSVAEEVLRKSKLPLILVRPRGAHRPTAEQQAIPA